MSKRSLNKTVKWKYNKNRVDYPIHTKNKFYFTDKDYLDWQRCLPSERTWKGKDRTKVTRKKEIIDHSGWRYWSKSERKNCAYSCRRMNLDFGQEFNWWPRSKNSFPFGKRF